MMMNMFSIFDFSTGKNMSLNWLSIFFPLMLVMLHYWLLPSRINMFWIKLLNLIFNEFKLLINKFYILNSLIFIGIMIMIFFINLFGLLPYMFTSTSHLSFNLSLSLVMWIIFMFYGWCFKMESMFIHLVPLNTPFMLMNFMVIIESVSNMIRPLTLSVRLSANMLAGHLMIFLLGSFIENNLMFILFLIFIQNMLFMLEIFVALIQSYVFSVLLMLYFNEIN